MALPGALKSLALFRDVVGVRPPLAAEYRLWGIIAGAALGLTLMGCTAKPRPVVTPASSAPAAVLAGAPAPRSGDEIMVAGQLFHTGAPVVLWTDPGGYDAYRVERRFVPWEVASWEETAKAGRSPETPNRYGVRGGLPKEDLERVRGGGWDLPTLQRVVDQFVIHYDVAGVSRNCFRVLHDVRGLSIHFMLDVDGTIYQTLDVKERAWHAAVCNDRSVGIEIANIGAYKPGPEGEATLARWYTTDAEGPPRRLKVPKDSVRTPGFLGYPLRSEPVHGLIQGQELVMYDLTREQYDSLIKLTATLCTVLPRIECDYPRGADGQLVSGKLDESALASHSGLIGHFHIQENKIDPGPAFQWDLVVDGARALMHGGSRTATPQLPQ